MPQPQTPVEVIDALIARKKRAHDRLTTQPLIYSHPQDAVVKAVRSAEYLAAIEVLREAREGLLALELVASEMSSEVARLRGLVTYYEDKYDEAHDAAPTRGA